MREGNVFGLKRLRAVASFCTLRRVKDQMLGVVSNKRVLQKAIRFGDSNHATTYEHIYETAWSIFNKTDCSSVHVFPLLNCLKQACCHAELVSKKVRDLVAQAYKIRNESNDPGEMLAILKPMVESFENSQSHENMDEKAAGDVDPFSPKVKALFKSILEMKPDEKAVIFSQYTSFLDILENALVSESHTLTRIDGSMSTKQRQKAMEKFSTNACDSPETPRFILCSMEACGAGITLTRANHVFVVRAAR
jgi:SNF2 family DNA or RNA helicase